MMRTGVTLVLPALLVLALGAAHLALGAVWLPLPKVWQALTAADPSDYSQILVLSQRLPRLLTAVFAGAGLAVAGLILQKLLRNALVSPSTLGINAGAVHATVLWILVTGQAGTTLILPALIGAVMAGALCFGLARILRGQGSPDLVLVLAGSLVAMLFSALTAFVVSLDPEAFEGLRGWLIGTIGSVESAALLPFLPGGLAAFILALLIARSLDLSSLGAAQSAALGMNILRVRVIALGVAITLAVSAVSLVGPIGFIGLIVPHLVRLIMADTGRSAVWVAACLGAAILTSADILARSVFSPRVLNAGTVMAFVGGCVFLGLILMRARRHRALT